MQLDLKGAVAATMERRDRGEHVGLLVPDEVGLRSLELELDRDRRTRAFALLLHQLRELLLVDSEPALPRKLLCQLEREPVRVVQAEGVLP